MSAEKSLSLLKITQKTREIILHAEELAKQVEASVLGKLITDLDKENKPKCSKIFTVVEKFLKERFAPEELDDSLKNKLNEFKEIIEPQQNTQDYNILMKEFLKFVYLASLKTENSDKIEELNKFLNHLQACPPGNTEKLEGLNIYLSLGDKTEREFYHNYNITRTQVIGELSSVHEGLQIHIIPFLDYLLSIRKTEEIKDKYYLLPMTEIEMIKIQELLLKFPERLRDSLLQSKAQFIEAFEGIVQEYTPAKIGNILKPEKTPEEKQELEIFKSRIKPFVSENGHFELFEEDDNGKWVWDKKALDAKRKEFKDNHPADKILQDLAREQTINYKSLQENLFEEKALTAQLRPLLESQDPEKTAIAIRTIWLMGENFLGNSIIQFIKIYQALIRGKEEAIGSVLPEEYKFILDKILALTKKYHTIYGDNLTNDSNSITLLQKIRVRAPISQAEVKTIAPNFVAELQSSDYKQLIFRPDIDIFLDNYKNEEFLFNLLYYAIEFEQFETAQKILQHVETDKAQFLNRVKTGDMPSIWSLSFTKRKTRFAKLLLGQLDAETIKTYPAWEGNTLLILAADYGNTEIVRLLLKKNKENLEDKNTDGNTALIIAASSGHKDTVELLLQEGADINATDRGGWTPLMLAAAKGHIEVVKSLLKKNKENLKAKNTDGNTALIIAASSGHKDTVELLLQEDADINATDARGWTPLMLAAAYGQKGIVELLLKEGADINATDARGYTPLMLAAANRHIEVVKSLLKKNKNLEAKNTDGKTALILAAANGYTETVRLLLKEGANINTTDKDCCTPLIRAAANGHIEVARLLINKTQENLENKNNRGRTALMLAAANNHKNIVVLLLNQGADINTTDNKGWTPLMVAADTGHIAIVKLLLLNRTEEDLESKNIYGSTALIIAASKGHKDVVELLLQNGADINTTNKDLYTPLILAAANGHIEVVRLLLSKNKKNLESKNMNGSTALIIAASKGHKDVVELLLQAGADINTITFNQTRALGIAASIGEIETLETIFKLRAKTLEIEHKNSQGNTALALAAYYGQSQALEFLIKKGGEIETVNEKGNTPLITAVENNHIEAVKVLLKHNANINTKNNEGLTALDMAKKSTNPEMVSLFNSLLANPTSVLEEGARISGNNHGASVA